MDHDAAEPEELNLFETMTCCEVQLFYLGRAADRAVFAVTRFADLLRPLMDDRIEPD